MATTSLCIPSFPLSKPNLSTHRTKLNPITAKSSSGFQMAVQYELQEGQNRQFHELPSGLKMEVITQKKKMVDNDEEERPPLVFVHGSFHGAWCWAEHWLPFFSHHGFDCHALSLLAQVFIFG